MRRKPRFLIVLAAGCGASPPPQAVPHDEIRPPMRIEWRAEQAPDNEVSITIVIDGKAIALGDLPAATESELGTPRTCAIRAAHPLRTELGCGDMTSFYAAELLGDELVLSRVDGAETHEVKRMPVWAGSLAVKPYDLGPSGQ